MDVGANVGIYTIWAQRRYRPAAVYCYEASPRTFAYLEDNIERLADRNATRISAVNCAIASRSGQKLVLNHGHQHLRAEHPARLQPGRLDGRGVRRWRNDRLRGHKLDRVGRDGVEPARRNRRPQDRRRRLLHGGAQGIAANDFAKIANMVMESDYLPETGIKPAEVEELLRAKGYRTDWLDRRRRTILVLYGWRE